ncbi:MAG: DnaJ family domain-containing protein [Actinomycetota bacterium]
MEQQIADAVASGELEPSRGMGQPIPKLDNDPLWWARSLLRREQAADRIGDVLTYRDQQLTQAVEATSLAEARQILAVLNDRLDTWNGEVDDEFRVALHDEIWLVTERADARL